MTTPALPPCNRCRTNDPVVCIGDELQCAKCALGVEHKSQYQAQIYDSAIRAFVTPQEDRNMPMRLANPLLRRDMSAMVGSEVYSKFSAQMAASLLGVSQAAAKSSSTSVVPPSSRSINYNALKQMTMHALTKYQQDPASLQTIGAGIAAVVAHTGAIGTEETDRWDGAGKWMAHAYNNFQPDTVSADMDWLSPSRRIASRIATQLANGTFVHANQRTQHEMLGGGVSMGSVAVNLPELRRNLEERATEVFVVKDTASGARRPSNVAKQVGLDVNSFTNLMQQCAANIIANLDLPTAQKRKKTPKVDWSGSIKLTAELSALMSDKANFTKPARLYKRFRVVHFKLVRIFGAAASTPNSARLAFYVVLMLLSELARAYSVAMNTRTMTADAGAKAAASDATKVMNYGVTAYNAKLAADPDIANKIQLIAGLGDSLRTAVRKVTEKTATTIAPYPVDSMSATVAANLYSIARAVRTGEPLDTVTDIRANQVRDEIVYDMGPRLEAARTLVYSITQAIEAFKGPAAKRGSTAKKIEFADAYRKYVMAGGSPEMLAGWFVIMFNGYITLTSLGATGGETQAQIKYRTKAVADVEKIYTYAVEALAKFMDRALAINYTSLYLTKIFNL